MVETVRTSPPSIPPTGPNRAPAATGGAAAQTVVTSGATTAYCASESTNGDVSMIAQVTATSRTTNHAVRPECRAWTRVVTTVHTTIAANPVHASHART